jgi:hypothetical protein
MYGPHFSYNTQVVSAICIETPQQAWSQLEIRCSNRWMVMLSSCSTIFQYQILFLRTLVPVVELSCTLLEVVHNSQRPLTVIVSLSKRNGCLVTPARHSQADC